MDDASRQSALLEDPASLAQRRLFDIAFEVIDWVTQPDMVLALFFRGKVERVTFSVALAFEKPLGVARCIGC